ncbi:E3 ubiquitin-protein ligase TRIM21-like isoform X1 [Ornithorhynchus anatinus]|uniref:E3 ubiquitin-protein ligase TRIM21-like isoform X1 n=1 Tax=Ornithorhynchus anatinus TaxID=9258 RepID=UPI0010A7DF73|nr:E3 ubiquitin-protein ligase TRIM21-like isoform X1 [Ornithorhynchus anatinus]
MVDLTLVDMLGDSMMNAGAAETLAHCFLVISEKLQGAVDQLKKKRERALQLEATEKEKQASWKWKLTVQKQTLAREFEKMHHFLADEEQRQLQELEQEGRQNLKRLRKSEAMLTKSSHTLEELITDLKRRCQAPAMELLQNVKDALGSPI